MSYFSEFIKLYPLDHPLGKKGGCCHVFFFFSKYNLFPRINPVPNLSEYDEILWLSIRPKVHPHSYNIVAKAVFYCSPNQNIDTKNKFIQQLQTSTDFVISKYQNTGIFLDGDANELKMNSICSLLKVK